MIWKGLDFQEFVQRAILILIGGNCRDALLIGGHSLLPAGVTRAIHKVCCQGVQMNTKDLVSFTPHFVQDYLHFSLQWLHWAARSQNCLFTRYGSTSGCKPAEDLFSFSCKTNLLWPNPFALSTKSGGIFGEFLFQHCIQISALQWMFMPGVLAWCC